MEEGAVERTRSEGGIAVKLESAWPVELDGCFFEQQSHRSLNDILAISSKTFECDDPSDPLDQLDPHPRRPSNYARTRVVERTDGKLF